MFTTTIARVWSNVKRRLQQETGGKNWVASGSHMCIVACGFMVVGATTGCVRKEKREGGVDDVYAYPKGI